MIFAFLGGTKQPCRNLLGDAMLSHALKCQLECDLVYIYMTITVINLSKKLNYIIFNRLFNFVIIVTCFYRNNHDEDI